MNNEEAIIKENLNLVYKVAHKNKNRYREVELEDLIQVGTIGLIKACRRFDKTKDIEFSTYAYRLIEGEILHYILQDKHHFKTTMVKGVYSREEIKHLHFDTRFRGIKYSFKGDLLKVDLQRVLDDKEYFVIIKYFYEKYTLKEISKVLKCSECWVKKLKTKALTKIEKKLVLDL